MQTRHAFPHPVQTSPTCHQASLETPHSHTQHQESVHPQPIPAPAFVDIAKSPTIAQLCQQYHRQPSDTAHSSSNNNPHSTPHQALEIERKPHTAHTIAVQIPRAIHMSSLVGRTSIHLPLHTLRIQHFQPPLDNGNPLHPPSGDSAANLKIIQAINRRHSVSRMVF